jgi:putative membrane protein
MMMTGGGYLLWFLLLLLFLLLAGAGVAVAVWFSQRGPGSRHVPPGEKEALEILRQRYARGEISREEYLSMREDLEL